MCLWKVGGSQTTSEKNQAPHRKARAKIQTQNFSAEAAMLTINMVIIDNLDKSPHTLIVQHQMQLIESFHPPE